MRKKETHHKAISVAVAVAFRSDKISRLKAPLSSVASYVRNPKFMYNYSFSFPIMSVPWLVIYRGISLFNFLTGC